MSDMKLIMESWRGYVDNMQNLANENLSKSEGNDKIYLIRENKQVQETTMTSLIQQYNNNLLTEEKLTDIVIESIDYEYNLLIKEGIIDTLKQGAKLVGQKIGDAAAKAQYKARQAFYKVVYGAAAKILKFGTALGNKAMSVMMSYVKKVIPFKKSPPKPGVAQKALAMGIKTAKIVGGILKKVASAILKVAKTVGSFFGHPVVKNTLLISCLMISGVAIAAPGLIAGSSLAFVAPFAMRRSAVAGVKAAGAAAVGKGKFDLGYDPETGKRKPKVNEVLQIASAVSEEMMEILEPLTANKNVLGVALNKVAQDIGEGKLDVSVRMSTIQNVVGGAGGETIDATEKIWVAYSDKQLRAQYAALDILKNAGTGGKVDPAMIFESAEQLEEWQRQTEKLVKAAIEYAEAHCKDDPAACAGKDAFINDINIANTANVEGELVQKTKQTIRSAKTTYEEMISSKTDMDQRYGVTRGGKAGERAFYGTQKSLPKAMEPGSVPKAGAVEKGEITTKTRR